MPRTRLRSFRNNSGFFAFWLGFLPALFGKTPGFGSGLFRGMPSFRPGLFWFPCFFRLFRGFGNGFPPDAGLLPLFGQLNPLLCLFREFRKLGFHGGGITGGQRHGLYFVLRPYDNRFPVLGFHPRSGLLLAQPEFLMKKLLAELLAGIKELFQQSVFFIFSKFFCRQGKTPQKSMF